jgi:hypothetical protein
LHIVPPVVIKKSKFPEKCFNQFWRIKLCANQYRESPYSDELLFKNIYIQGETFMDRNRYKVRPSEERKIDNPPKDRRINLVGSSKVYVK